MSTSLRELNLRSGKRRNRSNSPRRRERSQSPTDNNYNQPKMQADPFFGSPENVEQPRPVSVNDAKKEPYKKRSRAERMQETIERARSEDLYQRRNNDFGPEPRRETRRGYREPEPYEQNRQYERERDEQIQYNREMKRKVQGYVEDPRNLATDAMNYVSDQLHDDYDRYPHQEPEALTNVVPKSTSLVRDTNLQDIALLTAAFAGINYVLTEKRLRQMGANDDTFFIYRTVFSVVTFLLVKSGVNSGFI